MDIQPAQSAAIAAAITELTTQWGYRDITSFIRGWETQQAQQYPEERRQVIPYLCVLQTPEGGPVYCAQATRLFTELDAARLRQEQYASCPAPDPEQHPWMVVGNFELDEA